MLSGITLATFAHEEERRAGGASRTLAALVVEIAGAVRDIAALLARGRLARALSGSAHEEGVDQSPPSDVRAAHLLRGACERRGKTTVIVSTRKDAVHVAPERGPRAAEIVLANPLEGPVDPEENAVAGTIFSILRQPGGGVVPGVPGALGPGWRQVGAGYALYGPSTLLVLTTGHGVHAFTADPASREFVLTRRDLRFPEEARDGPGAGRRAESVVAEVHRTLVRGGAFTWPPEGAGAAAQLRLACEAAPLAMVVEQAGGVAATPRGRVLDLAPRALDEGVAVVLGSARDVARLLRGRGAEVRPAREYADPLFNARSLFRRPER